MLNVLETNFNTENYFEFEEDIKVICAIKQKCVSCRSADSVIGHFFEDEHDHLPDLYFFTCEDCENQYNFVVGYSLSRLYLNRIIC